jgi:predicted 2-oxoglutarate/Fe(II)-dependent dioxygenase YbiX
MVKHNEQLPQTSDAAVNIREMVLKALNANPTSLRQNNEPYTAHLTCIPASLLLR